MKFINAAALASAASLIMGLSFVDAQNACRLCGDGNKLLQVDSCKVNDAQQASLKTCCKSGDNILQCPDQRACRYVELNTKLGCNNPGETEQECSGAPAQVFELNLELEIQNHPAECCSSCSCAGDPHCSTFDKKHEEWILCDGRDLKQGCEVTKPMCEQQYDQTKTQCVYNNGKCKPNPLSPKLTMLLYQKGERSVTVTLGDRGIIEDIIIKENKNVLSLNADECKKNPLTPWVGTPIGQLTSRKNGLKWEYNIAAANAGVYIDCVHAGSLVTSPHLDVTITDTAKGAGASGFCAGDSIPKEFSHENSDAIFSSGGCSGKNRNYVAAKYFGGDNVNSDEMVRRTAKKFCYKYVAGFRKQNVGTGTGGRASVRLCFKNIVGKGDKPGWGAAFCAASLLVSKDARDCVGSNECKTCMSDIEDFGWDFAVSKYDKTKKQPPVAGPKCIKIDELPVDLIGCEKGIRIQYKVNGEWVTYRAIPYGYTICKSSGRFNSLENPELFAYPIRIAQCGDQANSECSNLPTIACNGEDSLTVKISTERIPNVPQFGIVELVEKGILVCKDKNDPKGCLSRPFVPCKACKGVCPVMEWKPPCTDCGICPM